MNRATPINLKRRSWIGRFLLMPYCVWKHYQVGKGTTSRLDRLVAAVSIGWLLTRPNWTRPGMVPPGGSYGGSVRLDEGPTMRNGFSDGPSTPKPAIEPRGQRGGYRPIRRNGPTISPPRNP